MHTEDSCVGPSLWWIWSLGSDETSGKAPSRASGEKEAQEKGLRVSGGGRLEAAKTVETTKAPYFVVFCFPNPTVSISRLPPVFYKSSICQALF